MDRCTRHLKNFVEFCNAMKDFPENAMLQAVFSELKIQWKKEQEQIAQKHVIVYEKIMNRLDIHLMDIIKRNRNGFWNRRIVNMYRGVICR